ncbi:MAG: hypothetical protein WBE38_00150 [Terracidiphilus sp.]
MIGTGGAFVLAVVNILFATVLGIGIGGLASLGFRQSWRLKVALQDGLLAGLVALVAAYLIGSFEAARGAVGAHVVVWVFAIALSSVVLKHLLRFALRSAH